jgi:hypothetical protein
MVNVNFSETEDFLSPEPQTLEQALQGCEDSSLLSDPSATVEEQDIELLLMPRTSSKASNTSPSCIRRNGNTG